MSRYYNTNISQIAGGNQIIHPCLPVRHPGGGDGGLTSYCKNRKACMLINYVKKIYRFLQLMLFLNLNNGLPENDMFVSSFLSRFCLYFKERKKKIKKENESYWQMNILYVPLLFSEKGWWMLKAPPANPRDYISQTFKISPREGR